METKPKISVLMGVYNCAETLSEAVQCIKDQTYENWELIMCDDCSSDNTLKTAEKLAETDNRIKVIANDKNLTLAPTLNKCLELAEGEYIARMDGDDVCAVDRFEKEIKYLEAHPDIVLVSSQMNLFDKEGIYRVIEHKEFPEASDFIYRSQFCHAGCMMKTAVLKELGGYTTDKECLRIEDYDLWVRMYKAGYKGANIQEALYSMRDDRNAVSRRSFRNRKNEARLKRRIVRDFKLSKKYYIHSAIPIIKFFTPKFIYGAMHKKK